MAYFWYPPPDLVFARTKDPTDDRNKILWVSHGEQPDHLLIVAHPLGATSPVVRFDVSAADAPRGNYPSGIGLPSAGCWHLELALGTARATMDVMVAPAPSSS